MTLSLNTFLIGRGYKLSEVRFLRHKDGRAEKGRTVYELWRFNRPQFELYQSIQGVRNYQHLKGAKFWASFVAVPGGATVFAGLYQVVPLGLLKKSVPMPHKEGVARRGQFGQFKLTLVGEFADLDGRLYIEWGPSPRKWIQRADRQAKSITEIQACFQEPEFPGFLDFMEPLSRLSALPTSWIAVLKASRGIYLLTCPKTKEQYVGSATGSEAFWHRWMSYVHTGHGGNVKLKSRDPSDYQVSILEVCGSAATTEDIIAREQHWKAKLQSRQMGLNAN